MQVGASHVGPEAERLFATLLVLATERGRRVSRARLIALIWPGADERNGRHCLRQTIYKLRQLGASVIVEGGYVELPVDAVDGGLDGLLTSAEFAADDVPVDAPFAEWLPGYVPAFSRPLQEWVEKQRDYVHGQVRRALVKAIIERRAQNRWPEVDVLARRCLALDPLNEEATLALAESAAMTGSKTTALRILDAYLAELGPRAGDIAMPAEVLRRRIAERLRQPRYVDPSEAYFVGRAEVMAGFGSALQSARGRFGSAHLAWGPSGIGKSRLAEEVGKLAALQGFRIQRASCQSTDVGRPLSIFADAIPGLRRLPGAAGVDPKSVKYLKRLSEYDEALADPPEDPYDSAVLFANVRRAIFDLFDAVTSEYALLFVIDDAHWLDAMSWGVLRELMEGARTHRLLILCTSRAPHATAEPPAEATRGLLVQRLAPLDGAACDELIAAVTRDAARGTPDARLREWTLTVAEGNPLFVRALIGHWMNGYPEYTLPPSLEALIEERLDRLSPSAMRVLQACAVLGKNSTIERLSAVLEYRAVELLDAVTSLESVGLVLSHGAGIRIRHDVLTKHTLRRLGEAELKLWHRYAGLELRQGAFAHRSLELLWSSVDHLWLAGSVDDGVGAVVDYAEYLTSLGLVDDAATLLMDARARVASFLNSLRAREALLRALHRAWRWDDIRSVGPELIDLGEVSSALTLRSTDTKLLVLEARWRREPALDAMLAECLELASAPRQSPSHRIDAALQGLIIADNSYNLAVGRHLYAAVADLLPLRGSSEPVSRRLDVVYHAAFGDLSRVRDACATLLRATAGIEEPHTHAATLKLAAHALRIAGEITEARSLLLRSLSLVHGDQHLRVQITALCSLAQIDAERGAFIEAESWFVAAREVAERIGDPLNVQRTLECGAAIYASMGEFAKAISLWPECSQAENEVARLKAHTLGFSLYVSNSRSRRLSSEELADAEAIYERSIGFAGLDSLWMQLVIALDRHGRKQRADELIDRVLLGGRRERYPLPPQMKTHPLVRMRIETLRL
jgi:DNA-binding SARP family transcriptional activator